MHTGQHSWHSAQRSPRQPSPLCQSLLRRKARSPTRNNAFSLSLSLLAARRQSSDCSMCEDSLGVCPHQHLAEPVRLPSPLRNYAGVSGALCQPCPLFVSHPFASVLAFFVPAVDACLCVGREAGLPQHRQHRFHSSVGQSVRLLTSRSGVRASLGARSYRRGNAAS